MKRKELGIDGPPVNLQRLVGRTFRNQRGIVRSVRKVDVDPPHAPIVLYGMDDGEIDCCQLDAFLCWAKEEVER